MQLLRSKSVAMIFQEPMTSLNPLMTVGQQLDAATPRCWAAVNGAAGISTMLDAVKSVMEKRLQQRYPHGFPAVCASR